ncbi:MAG: hypothetical protein JW931_01930 [Methanomicrobiaceae archaeon]|nr:hypothetical protein [Methanomicrobiaceae archaeon]
MIPNRLLLIIITVLAGALCLPAAGATNWPDQVYAPYINTELWAQPTIMSDMYDATGVK